MPFKPGQSGNPNGRPPKNRALTDILETAGKTTVTTSKRKTGVARKKLLAEMLWNAAVLGKVEFADGRTEDIPGEDWFGIVKFLYQHIDGPPRAGIDVTSAGEPVSVPPVDLSSLSNEQLEALGRGLGVEPAAPAA